MNQAKSLPELAKPTEFLTALTILDELTDALGLLGLQEIGRKVVSNANGDQQITMHMIKRNHGETNNESSTFVMRVSPNKGTTCHEYPNGLAFWE